MKSRLIELSVLFIGILLITFGLLFQQFRFSVIIAGFGGILVALIVLSAAGSIESRRKEELLQLVQQGFEQKVLEVHPINSKHKWEKAEEYRALTEDGQEHQVMVYDGKVLSILALIK